MTDPATRAVLFDMDGVLVQTDRLKAEAHSATVSQLGGNVPPSFYQFHMGNSHAVVRASFLAEAGLECDPREYTQCYHDIYRHLLQTSLVLVPGAVTLLAQLTNRGFSLAVVSSSRSWMMEQVLAQTGMAGFFQARVCAEDVTRPKPAPDAYLAALERLAVGKSSAVAFEDSEPGIEAALAAGLPVLGIRHAYNSSHDFSKTAAQFASLEDRVGILNAIELLVAPVHV